jgi:hypothetical protein
MSAMAEVQNVGDQATVVADPAWLRIGIWGILPALGALLGWGLSAVAAWYAGLPWAPMQGPVKLVASIPQPWGLVVALAIGVAAGLAFAYFWAREMVTLTVASGRVRIESGEFQRVVDRPVAAFRDGKKLVLLGADGDERARETVELSFDRVRAAFEERGYKWLDADPYADDYKIWVPDEPALPVGANALLKAREKALSKKENAESAELRRELGKLGIVVREEKNRQYWRTVGR